MRQNMIDEWWLEWSNKATKKLMIMDIRDDDEVMIKNNSCGNDVGENDCGKK